MKPRVAVIGCGYWGKNLVRSFNELGALSAIYDTDAGMLAAEHAHYPHIVAAPDVDSILADPAIDAVVLATPPITHYALARRVLQSNKHVFVEKPLALTVQDGSGLVSLAAEYGKILMVGHILHYHPAIIKMKELLRSNELGQIRYIYSNRLNIGKLRKDENILWSFAPHDISVILSLVGEDPLSVRSFGGAYVQPGVYDTTLTVFDFPGGIKAHIFVSWLHPVKEQRLIIVGERKMAVFDDLTKEKLFLYPHSIAWENAFPVVRKATAEAVAISWEEPLVRECRHFLECITAKQQPLTDGAEGVRTLRVLAAAEESLVQGDTIAYASFS